VRRTTLPEVLENNGTCQAVDYDCRDERAAVDWCETQIGKPYAILAIFGMPLRLVNRVWLGAASWFCTDYAAMAFVAGCSPKFRPSMIGRITPWDWWALPGSDIAMDLLLARIGRKAA
jgi:hypothetical protein